MRLSLLGIERSGVLCGHEVPTASEGNEPYRNEHLNDVSGSMSPPCHAVSGTWEGREVKKNHAHGCSHNAVLLSLCQLRMICLWFWLPHFSPSLSSSSCPVVSFTVATHSFLILSAVVGGALPVPESNPQSTIFVVLVLFWTHHDPVREAVLYHRGRE